MISTFKNYEGFIQGYIEWQVVNEFGQFENDGEYIYIQNMWVHPKVRMGHTFKTLVNKINQHSYSKNAKFVYWSTARQNRLKTLEEQDIHCLRKTIKPFKKEEIYNKIMGVQYAQM